MGLFDFLKRKPEDKASNNELASPIFSLINRYREYIVLFIDMQRRGNYSPISAYETAEGKQVGLLFMAENNAAYTLSAEGAVDMYVTPENMRFSTLEQGMKLTGVFQMQGQIALKSVQ